MRRASLALALAALAASQASCGGGSTHKTPTKFVNGHPCSKADEALQCILPPAPRGLNLQQSPFVLQGVDAAWGAPDVARMRANGWRFLAGYISHDPAKDWTLARVRAFHAAGLGTVAVFESTANRAGQGCSAGRTDAYTAAWKAAGLGNTTRPIPFAVDFDARGPDVAGYFRCAKQILGGRVMAYGSYYVVTWLHAHGLVGNKNWCTYAWSNGRFPSASICPLQQYLNDSSVDYDRAIAADYGQWPGPVSPKPKPVSRGQKYHLLHVLRRLRLQHACARAPKHGGGRWHHPCSVWTREGKRLNREGVK